MFVAGCFKLSVVSHQQSMYVYIIYYNILFVYVQIPVLKVQRVLAKIDRDGEAMWLRTKAVMRKAPPVGPLQELHRHNTTGRLGKMVKWGPKLTLDLTPTSKHDKAC